MYQIMILFYITWSIISLFNTRLHPSFFVGIMGIVMHLFFIPLTQLPSITFNTLKKINNLIKYLSYLSIPICILGIVQYYLPEDDILNRFVNENQKITKVGNFIRITSIFTFVKIYSAYLVFATTLLTAFIFNQLTKRKHLIIHVVSYFLLLINIVMTASRLPIGIIIFNVIFINTYLFLNYSFLKKSVIVVSISIGLAIITSYNIFDVVNKPIDSFILRTERVESRSETSSSEARISDRLNIFKFSDVAGLWGYGIGTTYQGAENYLTEKIPVYFEEEGERIVLELGTLGGIIVLLLRLSIFTYSYKLFKGTKNHQLKLINLSLLLLIFPSTIMLNDVFFNYIENFVYWFSFGLIIAISNIDYKLLLNTEKGNSN